VVLVNRTNDPEMTTDHSPQPIPLRRYVLLAALFLFALTPSAFATTLVPGSGQKVAELELYQRWTDASRVPTPKGRIEVKLTSHACGEGGACMSYRRHARPVIEFDFPEGSDRYSHYEFVHELGHVFDYLYMNGRERATFEGIMGLRGRWWAGADPPGEKFAMAYSFCALGARNPARSREYWGYDYLPTVRQHRRVCALIRHARGREVER
jgi:hypothetical protein